MFKPEFRLGIFCILVNPCNSDSLSWRGRRALWLRVHSSRLSTGLRKSHYSGVVQLPHFRL